MSCVNYDCIVVGGGHAGAEAAHAAAKIGASTLMLTISAETIAKMSCNPAIGGLAKGQIVREVDSMGGIMALAADKAGIQFRLLNRSKGPAVQSPRSQSDKYLYKDTVRELLERTDNLRIEKGIAGEVLYGFDDNNRQQKKVTGIRCEDGREFFAPTVILTTGTFLRGIMHIGTEQEPGGRLGEPASNALSDSLRKLGLEVKRLKTGTPVRLAGDSIDIDETERQDGDEQIVPFSFMNGQLDNDQQPCWITYTNPAVHELLKENLHLSPMYSGQIQSVGPRYCPSIETKIVRFGDKDRHQVFLEPEDKACSTIYCNGISTSFPRDIQQQMLKLIPGTRRAKIIHYAYAIEYDYCPAIQLDETLQCRTVDGLYMAGQINGTSGYEEAAGQGLIAGINATRKLTKQDPVVLGRDEAYIGVMIDDLRTKSIEEPYRMFTSRAEFRLSLRSDNADRRLTGVGRKAGTVDDARWQRFTKKAEDIQRLKKIVASTKHNGITLKQLLKRPGEDVAKLLSSHPAVANQAFDDNVISAVIIDTKYEGYLDRQARQVAKFSKLENIRLGESIDYQKVPQLRAEARELLSRFVPSTLGQAGRIGGITPADLNVIEIYLKKQRG
jgi:tRNA uridine 5-carboxymethylaminomethyl modification enzyme